MKGVYKKLLILFGIVIAVVGVYFLVQFIKKRQIENLPDDIILIEEYKTHYAVSDGYSGKVIYNDGSIYEFSFGRSDDLVGLSLEDRSKKIIKYGTKLKKTVNKEDLSKIRKYTINLEDRYTSTLENLDAETRGLAAYQYSPNKWIKIVQIGEMVGKNKTPGTDSIIELLKKYDFGNF